MAAEFEWHMYATIMPDSVSMHGCIEGLRLSCVEAEGATVKPLG